MYLVYKLTNLMMKPLVGYTVLYMHIRLHDHDLLMDFYCMVILRSTTGPYGRPIVEVAYGEMLRSLHRGCRGVIAREEWLGCRHDVAHVETYPGQHQCGHSVYYFFSFHNIKTYIYVFKSICI